VTAERWKDLIRARYENGGTESLTQSREAAAIAVTAAVQPGPGDWVLDLGAGLGGAAAAAAHCGARVVAIDLSPGQVVLGTARCATARLSVAWAVADMEALPFADGSFTCVVSNFGFIYAGIPRLALDEAFRVLAPRGRIALSAYLPGSFTARARSLINRFLAVPPPANLVDTEQWGRPELLSAWFGERGWHVKTRLLALSETHPSVEAYWQRAMTEQKYIRQLARTLSPDRLAAFRQEYCALAEQYAVVADGFCVQAPFLLAWAVKPISAA
jgi:ubiquinone/menaquinone biosynthesis C-methylase UbiE